MQQQLETISDFLVLSGFQYRIFDLGRKIQKISNQTFAAIEMQQTPYPYPFQQKAWLAILFWDKQKKQEPVIWFLSFPIDELGLLKLESRDGFVRDLISNIGENMQAHLEGGIAKDSLKESPFSFKPREDRLAMFHALATVELNEQPSQHYAPTQEYLTGKIGFEQWQFLGLQGISDVVARLDKDDNAATLASALPNLPDVPLDRFMQCLENVRYSGKLSVALAKRIDEEMKVEEKQPTLMASLVRALSGNEASSERKRQIREILSSDSRKEVEVLAAISGRAWGDLKEAELMQLFLEGAALQEQEVFNILLVDLMTIPDMRPKVLVGLRNPNRSVDLIKRIGSFMGGVIS